MKKRAPEQLKGQIRNFAGKRFGVLKHFGRIIVMIMHMQ